MIAQLSKNLLTLEEQTQLVQGSVGETVKLKRSDDWKRMTATAVFSNGELTRDVIVSGETLLIPWELLQEEGRRLTLNFHGADDSGGVVQTNIASLGRVKRSNSPSGIPPEAPTPARADQIQALAQEAMAAAAAVQASAASGAFDGVSPCVSIQPAEGGHTVSITDRSGTHSFTVLDGEAGSGSLSVDSALSAASENPVQNRVLNSALKGKADVASADFTVSGNSVSLGLGLGRVIALPNNLYRFVGDANSMIEIGLFRLSSFQFVDSPYSATFSAVIGDELYEITLYAADITAYPMTGTLVKRSAAGPSPGTDSPGMDGIASVGSSVAYARADHVHPSDTSKITAPSSPAAGAFLVWNGSAWAAQTLSTWQGGNY